MKGAYECIIPTLLWSEIFTGLPPAPCQLCNASIAPDVKFVFAFRFAWVAGAKLEHEPIRMCMVCAQTRGVVPLRPSFSHIMKYQDLLGRVIDASPPLTEDITPDEYLEEIVKSFWKQERKRMAAAGARANTCWACDRNPQKTSRCSACDFATYCSVACQRKDWPKHKEICGALATAYFTPKSAWIRKK